MEITFKRLFSKIIEWLFRFFWYGFSEVTFFQVNSFLCLQHVLYFVNLDSHYEVLAEVKCGLYVLTVFNALEQWNEVRCKM